MKTRAVALFFAFGFAAAIGEAQNPPGPPDGAGATIQSLAKDLAALTERVAKLEGQITAADLAGTYALHGFQNEMHANPPGPPTQVASYVFFGTVEVKADGTASFSATERGIRLFLGVPHTLSPHGPIAEAGTVTWTYADGVVTVGDPDGEGFPPLHVAVGGRVWVGATSNYTPSFSSGTDALLIMTRLK